jgi:photosystem II stability/assembly factor-like uncharacterized protein
MIHRLIFVIFACVGMLLSSGSMAGQDRWTPIGPVGAPITYIAADPRVASTLYASDGQHLFKSTDTGTTWRATLALPTSFEVTVTSFLCPTSYFVHPANGAIFATACYGLFRSLDGGDSWQTLSAPSAPFSVVGGDPHNGMVVYGLLGAVTTSGANNAGAVKSTDGGATWVPLGSPSPNGGVTSIVVDALQPQVLYAVGLYGVFRSTDGGAHWAAANIGLPASDIVNLAQIGTKLVLAVDGFGVFVSTDQAATWSPSNTGLTDGRVVAFVASPGSVSPLYLLAGLRGGDAALSSFRSVDDGATWTPVGPLVFGGGGLTGGPGPPLAAGPPPYVFTTTSTGMVISTDGGLTWHSLSTSIGLPNVPTLTMLVDSGSPAILYAATYFNGGYRSSDRGTDWNELGLFLGYPPLPQAVSPTRTGVVYGLSNDLARSTDYGANWTDFFFFPLISHTSFQTVRESASNSNRVVVGANQFLAQFPGFPLVSTSDDSGATWKNASAGLPQGRLGPITINPTDQQTMYAGVDKFVFKTTNGGDLWVTMSSGLSAAVADIAINPLQPNIVYVATAPPQANYSNVTAPVQANDSNVGGLYVSFDGGATWTFNQSLGHVALTSLALDPHQPTTLYAGSDGQGVFRSSDAGQTWTAMSNGLTTIDALRTRMLAIDPIDTRNLYVATDAGAFALTLAQPGLVASVIEYYAPQFDDYFITPAIGEIHVLDTQVIPGWYRTGYSFEAYVEPTPGANPLCRFYIPPASHFFSGVSGECAAVLAFNVPPFVLESPNSFYLPSADMTTGACPAGLIPVYRLYNNKPTVTNHRYTTDLAVKAQMVAKGYIAEGYGPNAVMMCAPP